MSANRAALLMVQGVPPVAAVTWNPSDKGSDVTLSGGDLIAEATGAGDCNVRATIGHVGSGQYYFEVLIDVINGGVQMPRVGIGSAALLFANHLGFGEAGVYSSIMSAAPYSCNNGAYKSSGFSPANGDILSIAVDLAALKIWFGGNGTWILGGDPAAGTNATWNLTAATTYFPIVRVASSTQVTARFASASWGYSAPSGFVEW